MDQTAFIFPGQGSQYVGMGKDLCENFKVARETFEEADDAIKAGISSLCFEGPEEELKLTENTQPAVLTVSVSALRVLQSETGLSPMLLAGHSLGEYSALVAGGALDFSDGVKAVRARGQFMQEAVPVGEGAIGAVLGLDEKGGQKGHSTPGQRPCAFSPYGFCRGTVERGSGRHLHPGSRRSGRGECERSAESVPGTDR